MCETNEDLTILKDPTEKISNLETEDFTENVKDIIEKLRNLQTERNNLLVEIEELKKTAYAKANTLESEVNTLREELRTIRTLMEGSDQSIDRKFKKQIA